MITLLLACCVGPFVRLVDAFGDPLPPHAVARFGVPFGRHRLSGLPVLSLDGRQAVALEDGRLMVHDTRTGLRTPFAGLVPANALPIAFVRNRLIYRSRSVGWLVDPIGVEPPAEFETDTGVGRWSASDDGRRIAVVHHRSSEQSEVTVSTLPRMKQLLVVGAHSDSVIALSPDGRTLAVSVWNRGPPRGQPVTLFGVDDRDERRLTVARYGVTALAFSANGKSLAIVPTGAGRGRPVEIWDVPTGTRRFAVELEGATRACFSPDGTRFALGTPAGVVEVWKVGGERISRSVPEADVVLAGLRFRGDAPIAVGYRSVEAVLWDAGTGHPFTDRHLSPPTSLSFGPDGTTLYAAGSDGVLAWDWRQATVTERFTTPWTGRRGAGGTTVLSPFGRYIAYLPKGGGLVEIRPTARGGAIRLPADAGGPSLPLLAFNADENRVASVVRTAHRGVVKVRLHELPSGRMLWWVPLELSVLASDRLAMTADGSRLAVVGYELDAARWALVMIDAAKRAEDTRRTLPGSVEWLRFTPEGAWLASAAEGRLLLHEPRTGRPAHVVATATPKVGAFSPDGRWVAFAVNGSVEVIERATGEKRFTFPMASGCLSLAFSRDGGHLAVGHLDATLSVYDLSGLAVRRDVPRPMSTRERMRR